MSHITGPDRSQTLLLPESVDEYVGPENPVRFIDAFVDGLDLTAAGFARVTSKVTGRPGYAPKDLLKLYIYVYLNGVRSSPASVRIFGYQPHEVIGQNVKVLMPEPCRGRQETGLVAHCYGSRLDDHGAAW